jgi:hypothetical protein
VAVVSTQRGAIAVATSNGADISGEKRAERMVVPFVVVRCQYRREQPYFDER